MNDTLNRREFLGKALSIGAIGFATAGLVACGKKDGASADPCADESGLTANEKTTRKGAAYKVKSPHTQKKCDNCTHWIAAEAGKPCGGCKVVKGPIAAAGYCNLWVKKT